jgi:hypothetical protein
MTFDKDDLDATYPKPKRRAAGEIPLFLPFEKGGPMGDFAKRVPGTLQKAVTNLSTSSPLSNCKGTMHRDPAASDGGYFFLMNMLFLVWREAFNKNKIIFAKSIKSLVR